MKSDSNTKTIKSGDVSLTVGIADGGRISSFKLGDYEFIVKKGSNPEAYGCTFWPSPQSAWGWPPPAALDKYDYTVVNDGNIFTIRSNEDKRTGYQFEKSFSAGDDNHVKISYSIKNISDETKKVAPWEIARANKTGLLFFPQGESDLGVKNFPPVPTEKIDGITYYEDKLPLPKTHLLSYGDGLEGWQAYAIDGRLFIKKFEDIKPEDQAPGEGEVLFYVSFTQEYIEIELEGKYQELKPGEELNWSIEWIAVDIPENIKVEKGNNELVEFVRSVVK